MAAAAPNGSWEPPHPATSLKVLVSSQAARICLCPTGLRQADTQSEVSEESKNRRKGQGKAGRPGCTDYKPPKLTDRC